MSRPIRIRLQKESDNLTHIVLESNYSVQTVRAHTRMSLCGVVASSHPAYHSEVVVDSLDEFPLNSKSRMFGFGICPLCFAKMGDFKEVESCDNASVRISCSLSYADMCYGHLNRYIHSNAASIILDAHGLCSMMSAQQSNDYGYTMFPDIYSGRLHAVNEQMAIVTFLARKHKDTIIDTSNEGVCGAYEMSVYYENGQPLTGPILFKHGSLKSILGSTGFQKAVLDTAGTRDATNSEVAFIRHHGLSMTDRMHVTHNPVELKGNFVSETLHPPHPSSLISMHNRNMSRANPSNAQYSYGNFSRAISWRMYAPLAYTCDVFPDQRHRLAVHLMTFITNIAMRRLVNSGYNLTDIELVESFRSIMNANLTRQSECYTVLVGFEQIPVSVVLTHQDSIYSWNVDAAYGVKQFSLSPFPNRYLRPFTEVVNGMPSIGFMEIDDITHNPDENFKPFSYISTDARSRQIFSGNMVEVVSTTGGQSSQYEFRELTTASKRHLIRNVPPYLLV